ncbi:hypothetical protein RYX56_15140 [Alkalihalophilus lindianensis]|uniref:Acetoin utilization protein AcuA n=1 Tax=Alkalihalophilus lindianensis TaxID=1630542 RepID=A0ABU3XCT7_9BACI|nr:hypothetical protein [Alkalihalophilus lindianensis]MDV2685699.1 hypothetical protein [Alkalihalophilus lindianensis]
MALMNFKKGTITITADRFLVEKVLQEGAFHKSLKQFRLPNEQQQAMLRALRTLDVDLALAFDGETILGYTMILPPEADERWSQMAQIKVLGVIEVAIPLRNQGLASALLTKILGARSYEKDILISLEYRWHWDLSSVEGDSSLYKQLLQKLLMKGGFEEVLTNEPDVMAYQDNFMMARFGSEITSEEYLRFFELAGGPTTNLLR